MTLNDKNILITGGTGSFGQKFTEFLLREFHPKKLIVFSRDEHKQHEMLQRFDDKCMRYFIGDVRDKDRLRRAMNGVDIVIHAAALKHVASSEYNPFEAVKTNILGTENVIDAAIDCGVEKVITISTDKAVNPINLYGATKLCAEKMFVQSNAYSGSRGTRFACCRYGNVMGSRGSVIPIFLEQRERGTVTVTDPQMTRFWFTLEQGVKFVIKCTEIMRGGEIFVPKIPSMNIMDLVKAIAPDCQVKFIGIQTGEKLNEILVSEDEARLTVELDDTYIVQPIHPWWESETWTGAKTLPDGFRYASDTNTHRLTVEELQKMAE